MLTSIPKATGFAWRETIPHVFRVCLEEMTLVLAWTQITDGYTNYSLTVFANVDGFTVSVLTRRYLSPEELCGDWQTFIEGAM
jgi:hypothetical protein